jgi:hypothetical protein
VATAYPKAREIIEVICCNQSACLLESEGESAQEFNVLVVAGRMHTNVSGRWRSACIVGALLSIHSGLLAWRATRDSPNFVELAYLAAGLDDLEYGRYALAKVNPPLVRIVAALPVKILLQPRIERDPLTASANVRPEYGLGEQLLRAHAYHSDALSIVTVARWACIPFSILGGYVCYAWARALFGTVSGMVSLALWCFSPSILANGAMVTADVPGAAVGVAACYVYWRWVREPTWREASACALILGAAELARTTFVVFVVVLPALWIVWRVTDQTRVGGIQWARQAAQLALILTGALYIVNLGYEFEGSGQPLRAYEFVSEAFGGPKVTRDGSGNRFAGNWLGRVPLPLPRSYLLGMDLQRKDFENGGGDTWSYLEGEWRQRGWWYYYLWGFCLKGTIGAWLLFLTSFCARFVRLRVIGPGWRDDLFITVPAMALMAVVSSQTGFSCHFRYAIPVLPYIFIWSGSVVGGAGRSRWALRGASAALIWSMASSLWIYPHSLSYFNELAGGPSRGSAHLADSSVDWGQDLFYLKHWLDDHPKARPVYLAFYGPAPELLGVPWRPAPTASQATLAKMSASRRLPSGCHAISVNHLLRHWREYRQYLRLRPVASAGYSIKIYCISAPTGDDRQGETASDTASRAREWE